MRARERAGAVLDMFTLDLMMPGNRPPVTFERVILAIEQAIIAAEEAKAKEEREACAMIAHNIAKREREMWARYKDQSGTAFSIAEEIEKVIRARSES